VSAVDVGPPGGNLISNTDVARLPPLRRRS
jgi:hypothetical protein